VSVLSVLCLCAGLSSLYLSVFLSFLFSFSGSFSFSISHTCSPSDIPTHPPTPTHTPPSLTPFSQDALQSALVPCGGHKFLRTLAESRGALGALHLSRRQGLVRLSGLHLCIDRAISILLFSSHKRGPHDSLLPAAIARRNAPVRYARPSLFTCSHDLGGPHRRTRAKVALQSTASAVLSLWTTTTTHHPCACARTARASVRITALP
jgi:hypothetical protein